ncbi:MAG: hypothetical protein IJE04_05160 [Bacilli bacterium]|nr:hypothetical protein [Bacilli bacterium]
MDNISTLENLYNQNGSVEFKLYSLDYKIEKTETGCTICAIEYSNQKNHYPDLNYLLDNHYIFGESIRANAHRIINIR